MARPARRREKFAEIYSGLRADRSTRIIGCSDELMEEGIKSFMSRADQTDCISFVVMKREGITDALTGDRPFEQAGFRALLA